MISKIRKDQVLLLLIGVFLLFAVYFIACPTLLYIGRRIAAKALLMQYFGILLPGVACNIFFLKKKQRPIEFTVISYALGYIFNLVCYFLIIPWGGQVIVPYVMGVSAVASILIVWKKREKVELEPFDKSEILFLIIFGIYLIFLFFSYSANLQSPELMGAASYTADHQYWLGNANAAMRDFPVKNARMYFDAPFFYHHISTIHLAFTALASGIDLWSLGGILLPLSKGILLFGAVYLVALKFCKDLWLRAFAIFALLFCTGIERGVPYIYHIYQQPFGTDIGLAFAGFVIYFIALQCEHEQIDIKLFSLTIFSFATCLGGKGPIGVVILAFIGGVCLVWLLQKKYKLAFSYGIITLIVFFIIAIGMEGLFIMYASGGTGSIVTIEASVVGVSPEGTGAAALPLWLTVFKKVFNDLTRFFFAHPLIIGGFGIGIIGIFLSKKMRSSLNIGLALSGFTGIMLCIFNHQYGNSQIYFLFGAYMPCLCLSIICFQRLADYHIKIKYTLVAVLCVLILVQSFHMLYKADPTPVMVSMRVGYRNMKFFHHHTDLSTKSSLGDEWIRSSEYEALKWLRDNTLRDSVVMVDVGIREGEILHNYRNHNYSAFSERQLYIEVGGSDLWYMRGVQFDDCTNRHNQVLAVYANSPKALMEARETGVNYIIQTLSVTPDFRPDPALTSLVFSTETINIFAVH